MLKRNDEINVGVNDLKSYWIGQSAAKPRIEEGSTTIPPSGVMGTT